MNWYTKYTMSFKNIKGTVCQVDIQELLSSQPQIITLLAGLEPVKFQLPDLSKPTDCVCGGGITINAIYTGTTVEDIRGLFTVDPQGIRILYREDNQIYWNGFLNSEIYNEDFSKTTNIELTLEGNDGLSTLERYYYVISGSTINLSGDTKYQGNLSIKDTIINCLDHLSTLVYQDFYIGTRLKRDGQGSNSIIEYLALQQENFYDEQQLPMTVKDVLNEICKVLNVKCFVSWHTSSAYNYPAIFFVDFKEFKFSSKSNVFHYKFNHYDSGLMYETLNNFYYNHTLNNQDLLYYDSPKLSIKPGYSEVDLTYSGYSYKDYFSNSTWSDTNNFKIKNYTGYTWTTISGDTDQYGDPTIICRYTDGWTGINNWNALNGASWKGYNFDNTIDYCLHFDHDYTTVDGYLYYMGDNKPKLDSVYDVYDPQILLYGIDSQYLKITAQCKLVSRSNVWDADDLEPSGYKPIGKVSIKCQVKINNQYYNLMFNRWDSSTGSTMYLTHDEETADKGANFENSWVEISGYVPVNSNINGKIEVTFYDYIFAEFYNPLDGITFSNDILRHVLIKDVSAQAVLDKKDTLATNDVKTIGYFDLNYKSKFAVGFKIGDSSSNSMQQRGALLTTDNPNKLAKNFYRGTQSDRYNLNNLLCKLYSAESQEARFCLTATVSCNEIFCAGTYPFNQLSIMTCPYLSNKVFMLASGEYNARMKTLECNWLECYNEDTINY